MFGKVLISFLPLAVCALVLAPPGLGTTRIPGFNSPSGNIRCLYIPAGHDDTGHALPSTLLCSIHRADYAHNLQERCMGPTGAGVDWHGWSLGQSRKGQVVCSGGILYNSGTQKPSYSTLSYGKSWRQGPFTCVSRLTGVTCLSRAAHGLFISRQAWRVW